MTQILWGITGAGDLLKETIDEIELISKSGIEVTTCLSKAGDLVLKRYNLKQRVDRLSKEVSVEQDANTPFIIGPIQRGQYSCLIIAPATSNTVAKIVYGIADTLITNAVAQAMKARVIVHILPTDMKPGQIVSHLPSGKEILLTMRDIDIENVQKLRNMKGRSLLEYASDIRRIFSIS